MIKKMTNSSCKKLMNRTSKCKKEKTSRRMNINKWEEENA
jgi:hypothetical protein